MMNSNLTFKPIWFDSLGAKSSCTLVETPNIKILIDPGVAVMHPGFPASDLEKWKWYEEAERAIRKASKKAELVIISHYHYDHFIDFDPQIYRGKLIVAKNPNRYINDSQRGRAENFFNNLYQTFGKLDLQEVLKPAKKENFPDPADGLKISLRKDFGDYNERRKQLLKQGKKWFKARAEKWSKTSRIPPLKLDEVEVKFDDVGRLTFEGTEVRFVGPLFHGIEYSRVGWVFATIIEYGGEKLLHTSDLNGPIIEDYAQWIIREKPDILILDGPMTYMLGYTLNLINFQRTLENALEIVEKAECKLIIYDHHLPREPKFYERTKTVWEKARKLGIQIYTASELLGKKPAVLRSLKK
ncbi:MBL fold metallo-hydrolase [Candidatus Bathyarchaeota archaeon]|nr:MAG: MBL fold metallo-hydrolase [Candidatus Bathyarchaeota archaeon]